MRGRRLFLMVVIGCGLFGGLSCGRTAGDHARIEQAQRHPEEGVAAATESQEYPRAIDLFAKGMELLEPVPGEPPVRHSPETWELYVTLTRNLIIAHDQAGTHLCRQGLATQDATVFERAMPYFMNEVALLKKLSGDDPALTQLKDAITVSAQPHIENFFDHYFANAYLNLGLIAVIQRNDTARHACVGELRSLGRDDLITLIEDATEETVWQDWGQLL